jgi:RNA polymerase sigma-70 factor, ECF subfamily
MPVTESRLNRNESEAVVAAARAGDESAFTVLVNGYRRELQVHCYRMLGSFEDAEDIVQDTLLRAWRHVHGFEGRSSFRAWLYRIATNACLDALARRPPRVLPHQVAAAADPRVPPLPTADVAWLEPYPDRLLEPTAPRDAEPDAALVTKETIELAFLVAIQHLPARQRAILLLRDLLGWPAKEVAAALDITVDSANSALQRARSTMRKHLPRRRLEWTAESDSDERERSLLRRYLDAHERGDAAAFAALLRDDVRLTMPPTPTWYDGRDAVVTFHAEQVLVPAIQWRALPTRANRQPAAALYTRRPGETEYRATVIDVLGIEDGLVATIDSFLRPSLFPAFGLPLAI